MINNEKSYEELYEQAIRLEESGDLQKSWDCYVELLQDFSDMRGNTSLQFGLFLFRNQCYEEALKFLIDAFELLGNKEVYELICEAFYEPNKDSLLNQYQQNETELRRVKPELHSVPFTSLRYQFIPANDTHFYIYDRTTKHFVGTYTLYNETKLFHVGTEPGKKSIALLFNIFDLGLIDWTLSGSTATNLPTIYMMYDDLECLYSFLQFGELQKVLAKCQAYIFLDLDEFAAFYRTSDGKVPEYFVTSANSPQVAHYSQYNLKQRLTAITRERYVEKIINDIVWQAPLAIHNVLLYTSTYNGVFTALIPLVGKMQRESVEDNELIYAKIMELMARKEIISLPRIIVFVLFAGTGKIKKDLIKDLFKALLQADNCISSLYPVFINSFAFIFALGCAAYAEIDVDRARLMDKLSDYYIQHSQLASMKATPQDNRIAIRVSQLLQLVHSPTLLTLNYAKYLAKYYPDIEFKIFVEDFFTFSPDELSVPVHYSQISSRSEGQCHKDFLADAGIDIYYSDSTLNRSARLQKDLRAINNFAPSVILDLDCPHSILRKVLYNMYPILDFTMGDASWSPYADIYLSGRNSKALDNEFVMTPKVSEREKMHVHHPFVELPQAISTKRRDQYNLSEDAIVLITVGNRLDGEMSNEFCDIVAGVLEAEPRAAWIIVGKAEFGYLNQQYPELALKQIIFIDYEEDLASLYKLCDIFVNPFRKGGGFSVALAMQCALPVVTLGYINDAASYVGDHFVCETKTQYSQKLANYCKNAQLRQNDGDKAQKRLAQFKPETAIPELMGFLEMAKKSFQKRTLSC
jgi:glycosyltransferase involved in cell wall biosynthesis